MDYEYYTENPSTVIAENSSNTTDNIAKYSGTDVFYESRCKLQDIFVSKEWPHLEYFGNFVVDSSDAKVEAKHWSEYPYFCQYLEDGAKKGED